MAPIRKGDGTALEIPGVSEVRSGDGRVFFEGDAIPDSVEAHLTHWYPVDEGETATLGETLSSDERDLDINGPNWVSDSDLLSGWKLDHNGVDDHMISQDEFGVNDMEFSACIWWYQEEGDDFDDELLSATNVDYGDRDDGWFLNRVNADRLNYQHVTNDDSNSTAEIDVSNAFENEAWYFAAIAMNGDNGSVYAWDSDGFIDSESGSGSRGSIGDDSTLVVGSRMNDQNHMGGYITSFGLTVGTELSQSDFDEIWEETKPE